MQPNPHPDLAGYEELRARNPHLPPPNRVLSAVRVDMSRVRLDVVVDTEEVPDATAPVPA